jgi:membrane protease YdiL (CAAX protease family)
MSGLGTMIARKQDFPFYDGHPVEVSGLGWLFLLASVALAFLALVSIPLRSFPVYLVPTLLFAGIPLLALRLVTGRYWTALFRPIGWNSAGLMILFAMLSLAGSLGMGLLLQQFFELHANPVSASFASMSTLDVAALLLPTVIQLIGEELLGILPFLAVLWFCVKHLRLTRSWGIGVGLLVSGLIFGAAHLPTYDWHWAQSLLGIGFTRVLLTLAYVVTKNLWVSAGAHILNDWAGFLFLFASAHVPIDPGG